MPGDKVSHQQYTCPVRSKSVKWCLRIRIMILMKCQQKSVYPQPSFIFFPFFCLSFASLLYISPFCCSLLMFHKPRWGTLLCTLRSLSSIDLQFSLEFYLMKCSGSHPFPLRVLHLHRSERDAPPGSPDSLTSATSTPPIQLVSPSKVKERTENLTEKVTQVGPGEHL